MATTEERLAALEKQMAAWIAQQPTTYYTHKYSGEEIDDAVDKIRSGAGEGAVRYDQAQTLTPDQQDRARKNIGTTWPCNPNLLDNSHFSIWQRYKDGNYSGVPNGSYVADRWIITSSNGNINSNLKKATSYGGIKNASGPNCRITQRLENAAQYNGMTLTLSVLKNTGLHVATKIANGWTDTTDIFAVFSSAVAWLNAGEIWYAAKLELGPTQTLAHQENGVWVLNEVPKVGDELRECQRYFWRLHSVEKNNYAIFAYGMKQSADQVRFVITFPVTFRVAPVITANGKFLVSDGTTDYAVDSIDRQSFNGESIVLVAKSSKISALPNGTCMRFGAFNDAGAYIDFSADL